MLHRAKGESFPSSTVKTQLNSDLDIIASVSLMTSEWIVMPSCRTCVYASASTSRGKIVRSSTLLVSYCITVSNG